MFWRLSNSRKWDFGSASEEVSNVEGLCLLD